MTHDLIIRWSESRYIANWSKRRVIVKLKYWTGVSDFSIIDPTGPCRFKVITCCPCQLAHDPNVACKIGKWSRLGLKMSIQKCVVHTTYIHVYIQAKICLYICKKICLDFWCVICMWGITLLLFLNGSLSPAYKREGKWKGRRHYNVSFFSSGNPNLLSSLKLSPSPRTYCN